MNTEILKSIVQSLDTVYKKILITENKQLFVECIRELHKETGGDLSTLCPPPEDILNAFRLCSYEDTRVVLLGQDPYPNRANAMGLSFSVRPGMKLPASLFKIYSALTHSGLIKEEPKTGDLTNWAKQGVLMLNGSLTTLAGKSNAHEKIWSKYTDIIIRSIAQYKAAEEKPLIFMLWGTYAKGKKSIIEEVNKENTTKHIILEWGHPSPVNQVNNIKNNTANFLYCDHFRKVTEITKINWDPTIVPGEKSDMIALNVFSEPEKWTFVSVDGGFHRTEGVATWAYIIVDGNDLKLLRDGNDVDTYEEYGKVEGKSTNNTGELFAIKNALEKVNEECIRGDICLVSDSQYGLNTIDVWSRGWTEKELKIKKNIELVTSCRDLLDEMRKTRKVLLLHTRGHTLEPKRDDAMWFRWYLNKQVDLLTQKAFA
jgi:uracil-DNA glycosylase